MRPHLRRTRSSIPGSPRRWPSCLTVFGRLEPVLATGDGDARGQALDVPLPGPGSVSSKSLASKTSARSGDANRPKFERCASPLAWTRISVRGVLARSNAMTAGVPR